MGTSMLDVQRDILMNSIRDTAAGDWKVLVLDETSRKLIDNTVKEDDILRNNITHIEQLESRRMQNPDQDAIYLLTPEPYVVDCLVADLESRRYRRAFLVWTSLLDPKLRGRIDQSSNAARQIADFRILNVNYFPREARLVLLREPSSFPILYHPGCNNLVRDHLVKLAQAIVSLCVSLGEYPSIRYYKPRSPTHEASVLCSHLARFAEEELDLYARYHQEFPPPSQRPRGVLLITDRSLDLFSPLVHEFTYQALAMDVLPIADGDKLTYNYTSNQGQPNEEQKEVEIGEKDKIWVTNRHMHMKDLLEKLVADFNKFRAENPHFADETDGSTTSVNAIKDMLVGLSGFQEGKEGFALHLEMAERCVKIFQERKLMDVGAAEQSLSTGLDEDYKKPKNMADQVVRLLDDAGVIEDDRLRLIILYAMYRNGLLAGDIQKLLAHAQLNPQQAEMINNLDLLGARVTKPLKDTAPPPQPIVAAKVPTAQTEDENTLSRFEPALKSILQEQVKGTLDQNVFPFTKIDPNENMMAQGDAQASLRSAKPTWARTRPSGNESRQRVIVFVAGGATYAESRACYEVSQNMSRDVILLTSHMFSPKLFMRQLGELGIDRRRLDLPVDRPQRKAPSYLYERAAPSQPSAPAPAPARAPGSAQPPPLTSSPPRQRQQIPGGLPPGPRASGQPAGLNSGQQQEIWPTGNANGSFVTPVEINAPDANAKGKLSKKDKGDGEKKKRRFFG